VRTHVPEWWENHQNLALLYRWLIEHDKLDPADSSEVAYLLEKPWKWAPEWADLTAAEARHV
jgi:hypothetical protein